MAGRIRTLKPEILDDERTAALSDAGFRLFVSALVLADDHGNLRAAPQYLAASVGAFAGWDSRKSSEVCRELLGAGLWVVYEVRGQTYAHIVGWSKHQRVDNAGKPRVPTMEDPDCKVSGNEFAEIRGEIPRIAALPPTSDLRPPTTDLLLSPSGDQPALLVVTDRPPAPAFDLLAVYKRHPRHEGKGKGLAKLKAQIRTTADYEALCRAQAAYLASKPVADGFVRHFDTWVNSWRDHLETPHDAVTSRPAYNGRG